MPQLTPVDPDLGSVRPSPRAVLAVFLGGCLGGLARYGVTLAWPVDAGAFPWAVLVINGTGAFALGLLLVLLQRGGPSFLRPLLGTGFLGAWTTFGAIVVRTDQLLAGGHALLGLGYLAASAAAGLALAGLGIAVGRRC